MALSKEDIIEIRAIILEDIAAILSQESVNACTREAKRRAHDARADQIGLTDKEAGETHRKLVTEW